MIVLIYIYKVKIMSIDVTIVKSKWETFIATNFDYIEVYTNLQEYFLIITVYIFIKIIKILKI